MALIDSGKHFDKEENHEQLINRMNKTEIVQYPLRIPKKLYKKIKLKLVKEERTLRDVLIEMLEEYVEE
jgi:hypothetical protein